MESEANDTHDDSNKMPIEAAGEADPLDAYRFPGHIEIVGDLMAPFYTDEEYEEFFEASCAQLDGSTFYRRKDEI